MSARGDTPSLLPLHRNKFVIFFMDDISVEKNNNKAPIKYKNGKI